MEEKNIVLYGNIDDGPVVAVVVENETLWLSQRQMAELFNVSLTTINEHLKNVFESGELEQNSTIRNFRIVATNRKSYNVMHYNLDAIIAVGYRVNSIQATHFRQWATKVLKEYIIKGFALDDDRLKQAKTVLGKDYFQELLERVRSIRASEQRIWLQITEIFKECSKTTTVIHWKQDASLQLFRTVFTLPSTIKLPPRLFMPEQTTRSLTWV